MSSFAPFNKAIKAAYADFCKTDAKRVFYTDVNSDKLWDTYLNSFPLEERQSNTCNTCRQFIMAVGGIVFLDVNTLTIKTLWDNVDTGIEGYDNAAKALSEYVKTAQIKDPFIHEFKGIGSDENKSHTTGLIWNHFRLDLIPAHHSSYDFASKRAVIRTNTQTYLRAINELKLSAVETVLELIRENNLYRGAEYKDALTVFKNALTDFKSRDFKDERTEMLYIWGRVTGNASEVGTVSNIRNSAIGTLLQDLSADEPRALEAAISSFEDKVSAGKYKRSKPIYTQKQLTNMKQELIEGGYMTALERRLATPTDLNVNNVLFMDKSVNKATNSVFDFMEENTIVNPKKLKVEEISANDFVDKVLTNSDSLEVLFTNNLEPSLVSLITAAEEDSKLLFKWDNPFSWSYKDAITDSIKEKVKNAGGDVDGVFRMSLEWDNTDDLDLSLNEPKVGTSPGTRIYYGNRRRLSALGGMLDVDANVSSNMMDEPVENITYSNFDKFNRVKVGSRFTLLLNCHTSRNVNSQGWRIQVAILDDEYEFSSQSNDIHNEVIAVFEWTGSTLKLVPELSMKPSASEFVGTSRDVWGIGTNKFHKVQAICKSPNYWGYDKGNEHLFFFVDGAKNDGTARGIFNEFLNTDLVTNYKRPFEALGNSIPVQPTDRELSGFGFSRTMRKEVIVRSTKGPIKKVYRIKF